MLCTTNTLRGLAVRTLDGVLGNVLGVYFDDSSWTIRYLTISTGDLLADQLMLISVFSILNIDWQDRRLDISLSSSQVMEGPSIDSFDGDSRQNEAAYLGSYGYPFYWEAPSPIHINSTPIPASLRDSTVITGYRIEASDGEIGHVSQLVFDDSSWVIHYLEVSTTNWWPGKKVLLAPAWVERISWLDSRVFIAASRDAIKTCPEYSDSAPISRDYEDQIYTHYGRPPYWLTSRQSELLPQPTAQTTSL